MWVVFAVAADPGWELLQPGQDDRVGLYVDVIEGRVSWKSHLRCRNRIG